MTKTLEMQIQKLKELLSGDELSILIRIESDMIDARYSFETTIKSITDQAEKDDNRHAREMQGKNTIIDYLEEKLEI